MLAERQPVIRKGSARPRIAPPTPAKADLAGFRDTAASLDIALMPWQDTAARYLEAQAADGRHLYREIAIVVARQNGKTMLLVPLIVKRLLAGRRIMHTAQDRSLPREIFYLVADVMWEHHADLFPRRNDRPTKPRYANGQEEIRLNNGGIYSIVAPTRGGARGPSRDLVIIDELREMDTWDFIAASKPTMTASPDPQMLYLSNAGEEHSVVLSAIRDRATTDPSLAYLEWSASPERSDDDVTGWTQANPAMGYERGEMGPIGSIMDTLVADHRTSRLEGTMAHFETEHLCRWVKTMRETLVALEAWAKCETKVADQAPRTFMGISYDPSGTRASAALAWQKPDGKSFGLRHLLEGTGNPINVDALGRDLKLKARENGVTEVGFDPLTDSVLAKYFPQTKPITGSKFANASARFVEVVKTGALTWTDCAAVGTDLSWTARKEHDESGSFQAVRADDDRPIPAALAAIRAVWLASTPRPAPSSRQPQAVGF